MTIEKRKLNMIQRLMRIEKSSSLEKIEESIIQAEMEARTEESLEAIKRGEVMTLDVFRKSNQEWLAKLATK
jgi:DNA topoisomerase IA